MRNGDIFNAYNAIHYRALQDGVNIDGLYKNITNTPNSQQIINTIKQYATKVDYFGNNFQSQISGANSIADLQNILGRDFTSQELNYRGLERKDFSLRAGQSKLQSGQLFLTLKFLLMMNGKCTHLEATATALEMPGILQASEQ